MGDNVQRGADRADDAASLRVESPKNIVTVEAERVTKIYKSGFKGARRFRREGEALQRLAGLDGVPVILERAAEPVMRLVTTRVDGMSLDRCADVPPEIFAGLRELVAEMLRRGVARHSIPARDIMVRPGGRVGMVDFERTEMRGRRFSPVWWVSCVVTRFHLLRLIGDHAPQLLSPTERFRLTLQRGFRNAFRPLIELRRLLRGQKPGRQKLGEQ
jgi:hypothetical protein